MTKGERALAEAIGEYTYNPVGFVRFIFPWGDGSLDQHTGPDQWQVDMLELAAQSREGLEDALRIAAASGHGIGKSTLVAWIILWVMSTRPNARGVVTANTGNQLESKTWVELAKWHNLALNKHWFRWTATRFVQVDHPETWRVDAIAWSERNTEAFAGLHNADSAVLFIFDEASAIPDSIWEVSEGGMTDGERFWFAFGNPTRNIGRFRECFRRYRNRWVTRQIDSRDAKMTNKKQLDDWVEDYGEDSDFVRVRVKGEFPRAASNQLIDADLIRAAMERDKPPPDKGAPTVVGVDVARFGDDRSVIFTRCALDGKTVAPIIVTKTDTMTLSDKVAEHIDEVNPDAVFIDETGIGGAVVDRLGQMGYRVRGVNFGSTAADEKKYTNKKAEIFVELRDWLKAGGTLPEHKDLEIELTSIEYGFDVKHRVQIERKDDMKKRIGVSPDIADALALTFSARVARKDMEHNKVRMRTLRPSTSSYL